MYIPSDGGDKSYYIKLYNYFSTIEFSEGVLYIKDKLDDFTLYFLLLIFSQLGISHSLLFGLITATTVCILFVIFYNSIVEFKVSKFQQFSFFHSHLFNIIACYFFRIRFYFALSFLVFGFYQLFKENNTMFGLFSMIFATTIHYSIIALVIPSIIFILLRRNLNLLKFSYLASLPLIVFFTVVILSLLSYLPFQDFDPRYIFKVISYTGAKEFVVTNSATLYIFFESCGIF